SVVLRKLLSTSHALELGVARKGTHARERVRTDSARRYVHHEVTENINEIPEKEKVQRRAQITKEHNRGVKKKEYQK
ncbi:hypothetical protein KI387_004725, partial [Taxus chinensis]